MGVEVDLWSEIPIATHAFTCGQSIWPMSMNESLCIPPGTFVGAAKVTCCQLRPALLVTATTDDSPAAPRPAGPQFLVHA